jgi:hypothetical protein
MHCESKITEEECSEAIQALPNNKSPGSDGLTANFYKMFWVKIKKRFMLCIRDIEKYGEMSIEQKRGIISLLPKDGKDIRLIKNWRPISLLNTDYKIIAKLLAMRIQPLLPDIIHRNQTGFIKGRYIGENIRIVDDVTTFCKNYNIPGFLLLLDYEKAFDTISWKFLNHALESYGFGDKFRGYVKILYKNINSVILNNGYMSESFTLSRGIRQGCPISAFLFVLTIELLANEIRNCQHIRGIDILGEEFKLLQFADDTALFLKSKESIKVLMKILNQFSKVSGLTINKSKCTMWYLGSNKFKGTLSDIGIDCTNDSFKYLGIWFSKDPIEQEYLNFRHRLEKTNNLLKIWLRRDLSLRGKVVILKSLAMAQFIYPLSMMHAPEWVTKDIDKMFFKFLWSNKPDKVKKQTVIKKLENGGLKMPDIKCMISTMKVKWLKTMFNNSHCNYNYIPKLFFNKMEMTDFMCCNYKEEDIPKDLPDYYKQCFKTWSLLKNNSQDNAETIRQQVIWYNQNIQINKKSLFIQSWYNKGIFYLGDMLNDSYELLSMEALCEKFDLHKIEHLQYCAIKQIYNRKWKKIIKNPKDDDADIEIGFPFYELKGNYYSMQCLPNDILYWSFIDSQCVDTNTSDIFWTTNYDIEVEDLDEYRILPYKVCTETKVQSMQFKILSLIYPCGVKLKHWKRKPTDTCINCDQPDNIIHHFYQCPDLNIFWNSFNNWWKNICKECRVNTCKDVLLGIPQKFCHYEVLNYIILAAKWFIYRNNYQPRRCFFLEFISDLKGRLLVLERIAYKNYKLDKFYNTWTEVIEMVL